MNLNFPVKLISCFALYVSAAHVIMQGTPVMNEDFAHVPNT